LEGQACSEFRLQLATWLLHTQRLPNRPPQLDQHHKGYRETWSQPFQHRISQIFVTCTTADQKAAVTQQLRKVTKTHSSGRLATSTAPFRGGSTAGSGTDVCIKCQLLRCSSTCNLGFVLKSTSGLSSILRHMASK